MSIAISFATTRSKLGYLTLIQYETMKQFSRNILILCSLLISVMVSAQDSATVKLTGGADHIGLSVSDLDASTDFFVDVLGFKVSGRDTKYPATFMNNGEMSVTLWQTDDDNVKFNRKRNVGLHHLAISVTSFDALDSLYQAAKETPGVVIEFSPELAYGGPSKHMMIREPSGNRLELVHRPKR